MKKLLAIFMTLIVVSAMILGTVAFADEITPEQQAEYEALIAELEEDGALTIEEEAPAEEGLTEEDIAKLQMYVYIDFDLTPIKYKQLVYNEDTALMEKVAKEFSVDDSYIEFQGKQMLVLGEQEIDETMLAQVGTERFVDEGLFLTKTTYVTVVGVIQGTPEDVDGRQFMVFNLGQRASYTNGERIKDGVMMSIKANQNGSLIATTYTPNWFNLLIALMIVVVLVLAVVIVLLQKKKKSIIPDTEIPAEEVATEEIAESTEVIEEVAEEVIGEDEKIDE